MAKYDVTYICGHTVYNAVELFGPQSGRDWRLARLREQPCRECLRRIDAERAAEHAAKHDLPALIGSDKQVAWAATIRYKTLILIDRVLAEVGAKPETVVALPDEARFPGEPDPTVADCLGWLRREDRARWWIDRAKDVDQAGKPVRLGGGVTTELGMLAKRDFVVEMIRAAVGIGRPQMAELLDRLAAGDIQAGFRAIVRGS